MRRERITPIVKMLSVSTALYFFAAPAYSQFVEVMQINGQPPRPIAESVQTNTQQPCRVAETKCLWDRVFGRRQSPAPCVPGNGNVVPPSGQPNPNPMDPRPMDPRPMDPRPIDPRPIEQPVPSFGNFGSGAGVGNNVALSGPGGYLDSAAPRTQLRLRYEAAYDNNRPDRAEFFYGKCGCFITAPAPFTDRNAPGPLKPEHRVDYQDVNTYLEYAVSSRFSAFIELPVRFLNPTDNPNESGFGDMNFGFKYAFINNAERCATFQLRAYMPTGDARKGLGTDHVSLEPGFLYTQQLSDRWTFQAQVRDWIAVGGTDFAGNVLDYGAGLGYLAYESEQVRVTPVVEMLAWSVLSGKELALPAGLPQDASGDTIANAKVGVRIGLGRNCDNSDRSDLYIGYGRALTGEVWYKNMLRVEYRRFW